MATAANPQGIMALPAGDAPVDTGAPAQPQLGLNESYGAVQQGLQNASPIASQGVNAELSKIVPMLDQLPDEALDSLLQIIQYLYDNPQEYARTLQELVKAGVVKSGDFPEEYDPEFLSTLGMVVMQAQQSRQGAAPMEAPMPPAGMARGGIAEASRMVASSGRGQDTMLAHITPKEAKMLRSKGGMGIINPATGLPEYGFLPGLSKLEDEFKGGADAVGDAFSGVVGGVKNVLKSPVGRIIATVALATFLGPGAFGVTGLQMGALAAPIAAGTVTAFSGGDLKQVLTSAATAYLAAPGGPVSGYLSSMNIPASMGITSAAGQAALNSGLIGTGVGLLTGQKLSDAVKGGLISAGTAAAFAKSGPPVDQSVMDARDAMAQRGPAVDQTVMDPRDAMAQARAAATNPLTPADVQAGESAPVDMRVLPPGTDLPPVGSPDFSPARNPDGSTTAFLGRSAPDPATGLPPEVKYGPSNQQMGSDGTGLRMPRPYGVANPDGTGIRGLSPTNSPYAFSSSGQDVGSRVAQFPSSFTNEPAATGKAPTVMDSLNRAYEGVKAIDFSEIGGGLGDLFFPSGEAGVLRTYGPGVVAGLAGMGAMGGFTPKEPKKSEMQTAMESDYMAKLADVKANPERYALQNMPSTSGYAYPTTSQSDVLVNKGVGYEPYTPPTYNTPAGAIGSRSVPQPYNTSAMYNFMPYMQYAADGGLMSAMAIPPSPVMRDMGGIASLAKGGYPRRTGQISGPGTATSDSIPAMLSDGEFVMTAKAVRGAGKGSRLAGAKKMYALMHQLEQNAARG